MQNIDNYIYAKFSLASFTFSPYVSFLMYTVKKKYVIKFVTVSDFEKLNNLTLHYM